MSERMFGRDRSRRAWLVVATIVAALSCPVVNQAHGPDAKKTRKLDRVLQKAAEDGDRSPHRVIVRAKSGRSGAVADRVVKRGNHFESDHHRLGSFTATVRGEDLEALDADPDVESVSVDAIISADGAVDGSSVDGGQNLLTETLGLLESRYNGDKVGVAVVDSGLEESEDLSGGRADRFYDFTTDGRQSHAYDDYGHGTHVATLIAGKGKDSEVEVTRLEKGKPTRVKVTRYSGIAPKARIISLKVLDGNGGGYTSSVLQALEFAIENRDRLKIDVINLSLGHPVYESPETDPLVRAVEDAVRGGIIVVASAGNYGINQETGTVGYAGITSPGNAPSAITVGAVDTQDTVDHGDDMVASYSSRGPAWYSGLAKPDIVAPGSRLVAVGAYNGQLYRTHPERRVMGNRTDKLPRYLRLSGTSMAAAVTTGVVALMIEANRETHDAPLTPNAIKAILEYTALPLPSADPLSQGCGSLNGDGAVLLAEKIDPGLPLGTWWLDGPVLPVTVIDGETLTWSQTVVWGNTVVWGTTVYENRVTWGQTVVWGTTVVWGSTVVWGTADLVWDDPSVWSQTVVWGTSLIGTSNGGSLGPTTVVWGTLVDR